VTHVRERLGHDLGQTSALPDLVSTLDVRDEGHPQRYQDTVGLAHLLSGFSPYLTLCQPLRYGQPLPRGLKNMTQSSTLTSALSGKQEGTSQQHRTSPYRLQDT
jgi:hypothetical protein